MRDRARVEELFGKTLPAVVAAQRASFERQRGSLGIVVEGAGSWTIVFGDAAHPIVDDVDCEADCIAVWTLPAFLALLSPDVAKDLEAARPSAIVGDEKLLSRLGTLLQPAAKGGLGARLAAA